ncbi:MAG: 4Fe-4S dicluster domain-containing protein [Bacteroidaceae bacterium]|nr:4Fe-4S dicluster domain-containing protein [Bacteroidaceae bacterium]
MKGKIIVNEERCKGCDLCVAACPMHILELSPLNVNNKGYHYVVQKEPESCTGCTACAICCPDACITVYREK